MNSTLVPVTAPPIRRRSGLGRLDVSVLAGGEVYGVMRRYDDLIDVRRGIVAGHDAPEQFVWHGRLWVVREIIAHWVRTGAWWEQHGARDRLAESEVWRVEAGRGKATTAGVFDLAFDWSDGCWRLVCSID